MDNYVITVNEAALRHYERVARYSRIALCFVASGFAVITSIALGVPGDAAAAGVTVLGAAFAGIAAYHYAMLAREIKNG